MMQSGTILAGAGAPRLDAGAYFEGLPAWGVRRPPLLRLTDETYHPGPDPRRSWVGIAARAMRRLAAGPVASQPDVALIGTGNGLDALLAIEAFHPRRAALTDLFPAPLDVAMENVRANLLPEAGVQVTGHVGDLLAPIPVEQRFDFIYENLPNLPTTGTMDLTTGITAASFFDDRHAGAPEAVRRYLLVHHWLLLKQAAHRVRSGGGVLTSIGGRVPLDAVLDLHRACGFTPTVAAVGMKWQTEAEEVLPGYARLEEPLETQFSYYTAPAVAEFDRLAAGLDSPEALARESTNRLSRYRLSATRALEEYWAGRPVAHTVWMVWGRC